MARTMVRGVMPCVFVVCNLDLAAALGLPYRALYGAGYLVGVNENFPVNVPRRAADRLDQATLRCAKILPCPRP